MAKQILVPLRKEDPIKDIMPCIERIVQPGMKVIFLFRYPVNGYLWPRLDPGIQAALAARKIGEYYSWDEQRQLAENKVFLAREAFEKRGVEVTVDVYTDGLRKVVTNHTSNGDVHLVMMRAGIGLGIMKVLHGAIGFFKRPGFSPMYLVYPGTPL